MADTPKVKSGAMSFFREHQQKQNQNRDMSSNIGGVTAALHKDRMNKYLSTLVKLQQNLRSFFERPSYELIV